MATNNSMVIHSGNKAILLSYGQPVAAYDGKDLFVSRRFFGYSVTTTRHLNKFAKDCGVIAPSSWVFVDNIEVEFTI